MVLMHVAEGCISMIVNQKFSILKSQVSGYFLFLYFLSFFSACSVVDFVFCVLKK